jgi:hypothetical protein
MELKLYEYKFDNEALYCQKSALNKTEIFMLAVKFD